MRNYEAVLKTNLPADLFAIVPDQYAEIKQAHSRLRSIERAYGRAEPFLGGRHAI